MSIVRSLKLGDFVDNAVQSAVNPRVASSLRQRCRRAMAGIAKKQIAYATLNIREIVKSRAKNIPSKFGADDRAHAGRLISKRGIIQS
jgi:DNA-binding NarL/FixJ family response regulator